MFSLPRVFTLLCLGSLAAAAAVKGPAKAPGTKETLAQGPRAKKNIPQGRLTDNDAIFSEIRQKHRQRGGKAGRDELVARQTIADPSGYEFVFGPPHGASNAPGYMGFTSLSSYDVDACAAECNQRGSDAQGSCIFFNIWTAEINGVPTSHACSMYYIAADETTAVNMGGGDVVVTQSRGYRRKSLVVDGGFEGYTCADPNVATCYGPSYYAWVGTSIQPTGDDANIFVYPDFARQGSNSAMLGSALALNLNAGTLTIAEPLDTVPAKTYRVEFFVESTFAGQIAQSVAQLEVLWNGVVVRDIRPGYQTYTRYSVDVTSAGNDVLAFRGGALNAWVQIDDVSIWAM